MTTNSGKVTIDDGIVFDSVGWSSQGSLWWKSAGQPVSLIYVTKNVANTQVYGSWTVNGENQYAPYVQNVDAHLAITTVTSGNVGSPASMMLQAVAISTELTTTAYISMTASTATGRQLSLSADSLTFNGYTIWHSTLGGDMRSNANIAFRNLTASAYVDIAANEVSAYGDFWTVNGRIHSDNTISLWNAANNNYQNFMANAVLSYTGFFTSDNAIQFLNTAGNVAQNVRVGSVLASSNYGHSTRVPTNGIYSLGAVAIGTAAVPGAGFMLDVNGPAYVRANGWFDGAMYLLALGAAPAASTTYLPVFFDNATQTLKARLPNGTIKTISWT